MEPTRQALLAENDDLKRRLAEAEKDLEGLRSLAGDGSGALSLVVSDRTEFRGREALSVDTKIYQEILLRTEQAIAVCDRTGRIIRASEGMAKLCGQDPLHLPFEQACSLRLPIDQPLMLDPLLQGEVLHNVEAHFHRPDGRRVHVLVNAGPMRDDGAQITGFVAVLTDITERQQAEQDKQELLEKLQAREEQLRIVNEELRAQTQELRENRKDLAWAQAVAHTGSWRLNVRQNKLTWSEENHRIFGIPPGTSMSYETFLSIVHPEDREYVNEKWQAALKGEPYDIEHRLVVDGAVKWVQERAELEFDDEGRLLGGFGITRDITEHKRAEAALRESEERLRLAARAGRMFAFDWDPETDAVTRSPEAGLILGLAGEAATRDTGGGYFTKILPEERDVFVGMLQGLSPESAGYTASYRVRRPDNGQIVWLEESALAIFDGKGKMQRLYGMTMDVTARRQAEEEVKAASRQAQNEKKRLEAVMAVLPVGMAILDERGGLEHHNLAFGEIWGESCPRPRQVSDYELFKAWWPGTGKEVKTAEWASAQAIREGKTVTGQILEIERFDGGRRYILNSAAPIRDAVGQTTGCAVAIVDITEQRRAEEALRTSEARLRLSLDAAQAGIWEWDVLTGATFWSEELWHLYGLEPHSCKPSYESWRDSIHPEDRAHTERVVREATRQGTELDVEWRVGDADGRQRWLMSRGRPRRAVSGQLTHYYGIVVDITDRKQAEEALRGSHQRLTLLAESAGRLLANEVPQEVVASICTKVMEYLGCDVFFNFLLDDQAKKLHLNAWTGIPAEEAQRIEWLDFGVAVCGCAARDGSRIVAENIQTSIDPRTELVKSYGIRAYACQPLLAQGQVIGTLSFGTRQRDRFHDYELALMQAVADQVAMAMEWQMFVDSLRKSREQERVRALELETMLETVPTPIFLSRDPQGRVITGNKAAYELLGLPCGSNLSFAAPEERPHYKPMQNGRELQLEELPMQRAIAGQKVQNLEYDLFLADGTVRHVAANAVPLVDGAGRPRGAVGAMLDLTAEKQAQEALRRAHDELEERVQERTQELQLVVTRLREEVQERLKAEAELNRQSQLVHDLYNRAPCGYHSLDSEGNYVQINDTELTWLGYTREEVVGRMNFRDILTEESRKLFQATYANFKAKGLVKDVEYTLIRKDGTRLPVLLSATAIVDEAGNYRLSRSTVYDLTDRLQAEAALNRERQRLYQVLEQLPVYVFLLTPDHKITYANQEFIRRFGEVQQDQRCYELFFRRGQPCEHCHTFEVLKSKSGHEWQWQGPDHRTYAIFDYPFTDLDGSPLVLELGLDISERQRAEAALRDSEEKLRHLTAQLLSAQENERKRIAGELHDELGHALLTLKLQLRLMEKELTPDQLAVGEEIESMVEYLDKVINDVRRLYEALTPGDLEDFGLTMALSNMVDEFVSLHEGISWSLTLDNIDELFPPPAQTLIYRILQELLTNIGKHAEASRAAVSIKKDDQGVTITVEDDGRGFDMEKVLITTAPNKGLGLPALEERVKILGGSLSIWSREGQGTKTTFTIPVSQGGPAR